MKSFGKKLKHKRLKINMTQAQVAKIFGFSTVQIVSNWERGLCNPPKRLLPKICKTFDMTRDDVIKAYVSDYKKRIEAVFE